MLKKLPPYLKAVLATLTFLIFVFIIGTISVMTVNNDKVIMGVQTPGKTLAGLSKKEVEKYFKAQNDKLQNRSAMKFNYGDKHWEYKPADIDLTYDYAATAERACNLGRDGNIAENIFYQLKCALFGEMVEMNLSFNQDKLAAVIHDIGQNIHVDPVNAEVYYNGNISTYPGVVGKELDEENLISEVTPLLMELKIPVTKKLEVSDISPYITATDVSSMNSVLASYTTNFSPGDRGDNVRLAASKLDGAILKPGAEFSFNGTVGHRTKSAGYKDAGAFINGELVDDVGGGVCQVSSTLYNAILLAGLTSTARAAHEFPVAYVPSGRDATVADDVIDFKFRNDFPHSVALFARSTLNSLTIYVIGTQADLGGQNISLVGEGTYLNPSIYRVFSQNGQTIRSEFMHTDVYNDPSKLGSH